MKTKKFVVIFGLFALSAVFVTFSLHSRNADAGIPNTEDARTVEKVLRTAYALENQAAHDFNTAMFSSVFVNDSRFQLDKETNEFVKKEKKAKGEELKDNYYFLDYKVTYYEKWGSGVFQSEEIISKAKQENRDLTVEERKLVAQNMPRSSIKQETNLLIHSIKIDGDIATVVFDDGPRVNEMHLVKIDNDWFIASWKILQVHA